MTDSLSLYFFYYFILFSLFRFVFVLFASLSHPQDNGEKRVRAMVNYGTIIDLAHLIAILVLLRTSSVTIIQNFLYLGVDFSVAWNHISFIFLALSVLILSIITRFSIFYIHRDLYYYKFFSIMYILQIALCLLILTNGIESIFIGWELLGITSILLIAFYEHRTSVLKNSLRILVIYKISDVIFYSALIYSASKGIHAYTDISDPSVIFVILIASVIKSSIFPWFWLPRAMEGPTPSSAVYYGGLATHIPIFIFLSIMMKHGPIDNLALNIIAISGIIISILCSNMLSRQINDAKNSIAYAAITQVGVIYLEIIFGFYYLAIAHTVVHAFYRSFEFLKAPSLLYYRHSIERSRKNGSDSSGFHYERFFPQRIRKIQYKLTYNEFVIPRILMSVIEKFMGLSASRINKSAVKYYIFYSLIAFILIEFIMAYIFKHKMTISDAVLFICSYIFNIIAMYNKYDVKIFFMSITLSVLLVLSVLSLHVYPSLMPLNWIYFLLTISLIFFVTFKRKKFNKIEKNYNYLGRKYKSDTLNMLIFFLGLSIVGMPGLGVFFLWGKLAHELVEVNPGLIIDGFFLLTLNMIVFFRFYYANYLGKINVVKQHKAVLRS